MHEGRAKPLDTVARQEVKAITGRQSFEPIHPDGSKGVKWGPVAALFSWKNAPDYWDDQRFILAEYLPLGGCSWPTRSGPCCVASPTTTGRPPT